ncbi:MAG: porin [Treponema sp.]|nr:MAG: porin [Treponema sp.]
MKKFRLNCLFAVVFLFVASLFAEDGVDIDRPAEFLNAEALQNWESGQADAKLELDMFKANLKLPADKYESFELIRRYAPYLLKDIYLSIVVDSSHRLGDYLAEGEISLNQINNIIDSGKITEPRFSRDLDKAIIYHSANLHEVSKLFVRHKTAYVPTIPPSTVVSKKYSGILIDARGLQPVHGEYVNEKVHPALFPRIWDTDMSLIFEKNIVDPKTAKERGIIRYSDNLDEAEYRDLIGTNPLRIIARGVFGLNRTDPIISAKDSAKILAEPENLKLLQEGRVVIICDDLKISPPYPQPDENFYFDYHDMKITFEDDESIVVKPDTDGTILNLTLHNIHFVADQPEILPVDFGRIDVIAAALRKLDPSVKFIVEGHTAELYRPDDQLALSKERAETMVDELVKRGIDSSRFETRGYGATRPLAPSDNEANRAKNRRVEIKIILN